MVLINSGTSADKPRPLTLDVLWGQYVEQRVGQVGEFLDRRRSGLLAQRGQLEGEGRDVGGIQRQQPLRGRGRTSHRGVHHRQGGVLGRHRAGDPDRTGGHREMRFETEWSPIVFWPDPFGQPEESAALSPRGRPGGRRRGAGVGLGVGHRDRKCAGVHRGRQRRGHQALSSDPAAQEGPQGRQVGHQPGGDRLLHATGVHVPAGRQPRIREGQQRGKRTHQNRK